MNKNIIIKNIIGFLFLVSFLGANPRKSLSPTPQPPQPIEIQIPEGQIPKAKEWIAPVPELKEEEESTIQINLYPSSPNPIHNKKSNTSPTRSIDEGLVSTELITPQKKPVPPSPILYYRSSPSPDSPFNIYLDKNSNPKSIDLSQYKDLLTDDDLSAITECNPLLEELNLSGCYKITDKGFTFIGNKCRALKNLKLSGCNNILDDTFRHIFRECPQLIKISIDGCSKISNNAITSSFLSRPSSRELQELNFSGCDLQDNTIRAIAYKCPNLIKISLNNNSKISNNALSYLFNKCTKLQKVYLSGCGNLLNSCIKVLSKKCKSLKNLDISFCTHITDLSLRYLAKLKKLEFLNLQNCINISNGDGAAISNLQEDKDDNYIFTEGLIYFARNQRLIGYPLKHLNISNCPKITEDGINTIGIYCRNLRYLNISGSSINRINFLMRYLKSLLPDLEIRNDT
ncbi:MAG: hypothetical protein WC436_02005 [Candidatus Babeliales bacterium]